MTDARARRFASSVERSRVVTSLTRYDLLLALIPSVFLVSFLLGFVLGVPTRTALVGASIIGGFAVCDALFLNPPTSGGR